MSIIGSRLRRLLQTFRSDERGVSLALTALFLVGMVGLTSMVIDVGNGWLSRQRLIPATDAAALAAAQDLIDRPWDKQAACTTARAYVADNAPTGGLVDCNVSSFSPVGGQVTVSADEDFDPLFSEVTTDGGIVRSVSTATWGPPLTVSALRPIGLCYDGSAELRDLIDNPRQGPIWIEVAYTKDDPAACGGAAALGNYATIDFEGGTGVNEIRDWMLHGYPEQIAFDSPGIPDCQVGATCYDRPYASNDIKPELHAVQSSQQYISFPVFNYSDADLVHIIGMVRARLYDFNLSGSTDTWWIQLKVDPGLITGTCCGPGGLVSGNQVIAICGVDVDAYSACTPEGP